MNITGKDDLYHDNSKLPVYSRTSARMDAHDIVNALLDPELEESKVCSMHPVNTENNAVFIVDLGMLKSVKDLYCDDMGSWQYNGVYHLWLEVDETGFVSTLGKDWSKHILHYKEILRTQEQQRLEENCRNIIW